MRAFAASKGVTFLILFVAAALEVGGDVLIRKGLRGGGAALAVVGFFVLGSYGVLVNLLDLDFSRLFGAYVGAFALVSVVAGQLLFDQPARLSTWIGLGIVLVGSGVILAGDFGR